MKTALVIMAAGMGSRFGGIKQLEPVGPSGEIIMDYSIYDAMEAGFEKIIFIIRRDIEEDFRRIIGNRIEKLIEVEYVFQDTDNLPDGYEKPQGREKPWGTGHAILSCLGTIKEPFAVINADDYYGKEAFVKVNEFLKHPSKSNAKYHFCMAGFFLGNTLSENGTVTRGICKVNKEKILVDIVETQEIARKGENAIGEVNGKPVEISLDCPVSMNMWGFTPEFLDELGVRFEKFLDRIDENPLKAEYLLPSIVDDLIKEGSAQVSVLETHDRWFGVTYREDKEMVIDSFANLVKHGVYPKKLFED